MKTRRQEILDTRLRTLVESDMPELLKMKTGRGTLNKFVSGLVLSSALMEEISRAVPDNLHVAWGQILDYDNILSGEIDIMTYHGKPLHEWKRIGYAIIEKQQVDTIFEVKRSFRSYPVHRKEYERFSNFCNYIYLIIYRTSITRDGIEKRKEKLQKIGYQDAFHLIRYKKPTKKSYGVIAPLEDEWYRLMDTVSTWGM